MRPTISAPNNGRRHKKKVIQTVAHPSDLFRRIVPGKGEMISVLLFQLEGRGISARQAF
jgi:hypothetical protein